MFGLIVQRLFRSRIALCSWGLALAGCLCLSGCVSMDDLRGESFPDDENSRLCEQLRAHDHNNDSFVFSNKARQINRHLGGE